MRLIVRWVRISVEESSEDPRSGRGRTVPAEQLALALKGRVEYVYGDSFVEQDLRQTVRIVSEGSYLSQNAGS